eukprot:TRINITY_DN5842_c0_g1_i8.p1 TRINITY_DN5842_c0_g1~~TRINITY_DN5842_c0_g1_i8.p1  ORF type:complete len:433 (-),score=26.50 TRINITY_DN5842_c0_g1_i8:673-1971(-)
MVFNKQILIVLINSILWTTLLGQPFTPNGMSKINNTKQTDLEVPQSVCAWNDISKSCQQSPEKIIALLSTSSNPYGLMMRCTYAEDQTTCESMSNETCVWHENYCHINAQYLSFHMSFCIEHNNGCDEALLNSTRNITWIDPEEIDPISSACEFKSSSLLSCKTMIESLYCYEWRNDTQKKYFTSQHFHSLIGEEDILAPLISSLNAKEACTKYQIQQHEYGLQVIEDIAYLMSAQTDYEAKAMLQVQFIEQLLGIPPGYLQMYDMCNTFNDIQCISSPDKVGLISQKRQPHEVTYKDEEKDDDKDGLSDLVIVILVLLGIFLVVFFWIFIYQVALKIQNRKLSSTYLTVQQLVQISGTIDRLYIQQSLSHELASFIISFSSRKFSWRVNKNVPSQQNCQLVIFIFFYVFRNNANLKNQMFIFLEMQLVFRK